MTWLFDPSIGQFAGEFTVSPDEDSLVFQHDGGDKRPSQRPEGEEMYTQLANLVIPKKQKLHDFDYLQGSDVLLKEVIPPNWELIGLEDEIVGKGKTSKKVKGVLSMARILGPLFGEAGIDTDSSIVREPIAAWYSAAKILNFAIKAKAVIDGRASSDWLDGETQYMYYTRACGNYVWIGFKLFFEPFPEPYRAALSYTEEEISRILPETSAAPSSGSVRSSWAVNDAGYGCAPVLRCGYSSGNHKEPYVGDPTLVSNQFMRNSGVSNLQTSDALVSEMVRAIVSLHTARITLGWNKPLDNGRGTEFGVQYNNFLEHLWHSFAIDAADCKIGVCGL